jgi:hypothetical protein
LHDYEHECPLRYKRNEEFNAWRGRDAKRRAKSKKDERRLEARGGIEPPIKVLQTFALPLGDRARDISRVTADRKSVS